MDHSEPKPNEDRPRLGEYDDERDMDSFWREIAPRREPMQKRWFLPVLFALLALSVPWYLPKGQSSALIAGLPYWVWITLVCSLGMSILAASLALGHWEDEEFEAGEEDEAE